MLVALGRLAMDSAASNATVTMHCAWVGCNQIALQGMLRLDLHEAIRAVNNDIGSVLNLSLHQASLGVVEIVDENMAAAARSHAAEWGKSLVGRTLIAFGGAAPLHAARLIEKLDLAAVIVPIGAGVGSAWVFLVHLSPTR